MKENRKMIISKCRFNRFLEDGMIRERRQQPDSLSSPAKGRALTAQTPSDGDRLCRNAEGAGAT